MGLPQVNPRGVVHVTEGNGGVPGVVGTFAMQAGCDPGSPSWCRKRYTMRCMQRPKLRCNSG